MKRKISVVLPCHNEGENLPILIPKVIKNIPKRYSYEIICVDDGSRDKTTFAISKLARKNKKIKGIIFYRNFGHQAALRAGIQNSKGKCVITMDSDFQHPPEKLPEMINAWEKGYDLVLAKKIEDKTQSFWLMIQRKIGYWIWSKFTNGIIEPGISDFRLIDASVVNFLKNVSESEIFFRGAVTLGARNPIIVPYKVGKRLHGKSSYTLNMFINMFLNGFISFSPRPLRTASFFGIIAFVCTTVFILFDIIRAFLTGKRIIEGWITAVAITIIVNSVLMLYLGILGEYIGVIFREVKKRPHYLIEKTINL